MIEESRSITNRSGRAPAPQARASSSPQAPSSWLSADRAAILQALERHDVRYVLIGGVAAQTRGWRGITEDIDVTPARDRDNLDRLARVLTELDARFRVEGHPDGFRPPGGIDARTFKDQVSLALLTRHGPFDIALLPDGTHGYADLSRQATRETVFGTTVAALVASAEDILRSKAAAGRAKDLAMLPQLRIDFERAREVERPGLEL